MKRALAACSVALLCAGQGSLASPAVSSPARAPGIGTQPAPSEPKFTASGQKAASRRAVRALAGSIRFERNEGQTGSSVEFVSRYPGGEILITRKGAVLRWSDGDTGDKPGRAGQLRIRPVGGDPAAVFGRSPLAAVTNYLLGSDASRWRTSVPTFGRVVYREVYPGVDIAYYGNRDGKLEYDFIVAPGADSGRIAVAFDGSTGIKVRPDGKLSVSTPAGQIVQERPFAYQIVSGQKKKVRVSYSLVKSSVFFRLGGYDRTRTLIIDPAVQQRPPSLWYSTYLGGGGSDRALGVAVDSKGSAYITGVTNSAVFPTTTTSADPYCGTDKKCDPVSDGIYPLPELSGKVRQNDAFVTKLTPDGSDVVYSTYLGGNRADEATSIAVDQNGRAYVAGVTHSADFPTTPGAADRKCGTDATGNCDLKKTEGSTDLSKAETRGDVFVAKLAASGRSLDYSTFLGGRGDDGRAGSVSYYANAHGALGPEGDEVEASGGGTTSPPHHNGPHPGSAVSIAIDEKQNVFVAGATLSHDFPTTLNAIDRKCGTDGKCDRTAFTKGCGADGIVPAGQPRHPGSTTLGCQSYVRLYPDVFLTRLDTGSSGVVYSTFLGGRRADFARGMALWTQPVTGRRYVYLAGKTDSPPNAPQFPRTGFTATFDAVAGVAGLAPSPPTEGPDNPFPTTAGAFLVAKPAGSTPWQSQAETDWAFAENESDVFFSRVEMPEPGRAALDYSTYLGASGADDARGIAVDAAGSAYVTGATSTTAFPVKGDGAPPFQAANAWPSSNGGSMSEAFVAKFNPNRQGQGSLVYSTYLGSKYDTSRPDSGLDAGRAIAVDSDGRAYVAGITNGSTFPVTPDAIQRKSGSPGSRPCPGTTCPDAFLSVLEPKGDRLLHSTYIGGNRHRDQESGHDEARALALWNNPTTGALYAVVAGSTRNDDYPTLNAYQRYSSGYFEAVVTSVGIFPEPRMQIGSLDPSTSGGPSSGGTRVTIRGEGLYALTGIRFGDEVVACPSPRCEPAMDGRSVVATTPPHREGFVDVQAIRGGETSPLHAGATFLYFAGNWSSEGRLTIARSGQTATLLDGDNCAGEGERPSYCGKVLIVGGVERSAPEAVRKTVQLFDPRPHAGSWSSPQCAPAGPMCPGPQGEPRITGHSATVLKDGRVLVVGGVTVQQARTGAGNVWTSSEKAEIYDPRTGKWSSQSCAPATVSRDCPGPLTVGRSYHASALLDDGRVLVAGGLDQEWGSTRSRVPDLARHTAEIFDPATGQWRPTAPLIEPRRRGHTATTLPDGRVLLAGGEATPDDPTVSENVLYSYSVTALEIFDPKANLGAGAWVTAAQAVGRYDHSATLLPDGKVLLAGGVSAIGGEGLAEEPTSSVELFDPGDPDTAPSVKPVMGLSKPRSGHAAAPLPGGRVMIVGGSDLHATTIDTWTPLDTVEIYDPSLNGGAGGWKAGKPVGRPVGQGKFHPGHTATLLDGSGPNCGANCGRVLLVGGVSVARPVTSTVHNPSPAKDGFKDQWSLFEPSPSIAAVEPSSGPVEGGSRVTISGTGFEGARVLFGNQLALSCGGCPPDTSQTITRLAPKGADTHLPKVRVITDGLGMAEAAKPFVYTGPPGPVLNLRAQAVSPDSARLTFKAAGLIRGVGPPATKYVVKIASASITESNFAEQKSVCPGDVCEFGPKSKGDRLELMVDGLEEDWLYVFAARAVDDNGRPGPVSNLALHLTSSPPPGTIRDLTAVAISPREVHLSFSAPGTDEDQPPPAVYYMLRQELSSDPLSDPAVFGRDKSLCNSEISINTDVEYEQPLGVCAFEAKRVGDRVKVEIGNLKPNTTYQYALRAFDTFFQIGPISNVAVVTTATLPAKGVQPEEGGPPVKKTIYKNGPPQPPQIVATVIDEPDQIIFEAATSRPRRPAFLPAGPSPQSEDLKMAARAGLSAMLFGAFWGVGVILSRRLRR